MKGTDMEEPQVTQTTPPAPAPVPPTPEPPKSDPGASGDNDAAMRRVQEERDTLKTQLKEVQDKLAEAKTVEDVENAKKSLQADYEAHILSNGIDLALVKAGCIDVAAAKAHIDTTKLKLDGEKVEGLSVDDLTKNYPYLFQQVSKTATGAPPAGALDKSASYMAQLRRAAGLAMVAN
jgi:hypothetical protein